jgi:hypothetical protein
VYSRVDVAADVAVNLVALDIPSGDIPALSVTETAGAPLFIQ